MNEEIVDRIMYHKTCMSECEEQVKNIWDQYKKETRKDLDEYQLNSLLMWRKEEITKSITSRNLHHIEKNWLTRLLKHE